MKRICFLCHNQSQAHAAIQTLRERGIPDRHLYVVAAEGVQTEGLPDAGPENDDFIPAYKRGLALGGVGGLFAGLIVMTFPPAGIVLGGGALLLSTLAGASLGGLAAGLVGTGFSSTRLEQFKEALEAGSLIILADVEDDDVESHSAAVQAVAPEIEVIGPEPSATLVP
jgi:hypothetical protein